MIQENSSSVDIRAINEKIEKESAFVDLLMMEMNKVIVGQKHMIERLLIGLLGNGHILLEGVPGLAKTLAINTLAKAVHGDFSRIQFTPDLLPADVVGTMIYSVKDNDFTIKKGPIFANFVLADEINRAPAKVQSALLEAMQERQITIGDTTFKLDVPFLVMATQNPIEQEGTYPLPEAQIDRFMLKTVIDYPKMDEEQLIMRANLKGSFSDFMRRKYEMKLYVKKNKIHVKCIPTSLQIKLEAEKGKLHLMDTVQDQIDVVFDGADQIDKQKNLIKGGGGALLRENILISAAKKVVIMADDSKFVKNFNIDLSE